MKFRYITRTRIKTILQLIDEKVVRRLSWVFIYVSQCHWRRVCNLILCYTKVYRNTIACYTEPCALRGIRRWGPELRSFKHVKTCTHCLCPWILNMGDYFWCPIFIITHSTKCDQNAFVYTALTCAIYKTFSVSTASRVSEKGYVFSLWVQISVIQGKNIHSVIWLWDSKL